MSQIVGLGTDIVECLRIAQMIERHAEQFINRIYTTSEIEFCRSRRQATQHFAARWAAKQAVLRALGLAWQPGLRWRDLEIRPERSGPQVALHGQARQAARLRGVAQVRITLAYCRSHATATALALAGSDPDGGHLDGSHLDSGDLDGGD